MSDLLGRYGIILALAVMVGCQPSESDQEVPSNGMVMTGDYSGSAFTIATTYEDEIFMDMVEAYNNMDAEELWASSADTIEFHGSDGSVGPLTQADMEAFFSSVDSLSWEMDAVIPVKAVGSNRVNILVDSREVVYMNDGSVQRRKLFERFIFEEGTLVGVRQWEAAMPANQGM